MKKSLKTAAFVSKILAVIVWLGMALLTIGVDISEMYAPRPPREAPPDWGTPAYFHRTYLDMALVLVVAVLSIIPNRRLVLSPRAFSLSLLVALLPLCVALIHTFSDPPNIYGRDSFDLVVWAFVIVLFGSLPLSLTLSFWRNRKEQEVTYA
jgi:hypothetical protein